jgi:hypothetical protein
MKKKIIPGKIVPYKDGNPPRQTKGAQNAKLPPTIEVEIISDSEKPAKEK